MKNFLNRFLRRQSSGMDIKQLLDDATSDVVPRATVDELRTRRDRSSAGDPGEAGSID